MGLTNRQGLVRGTAARGVGASRNTVGKILTFAALVRCCWCGPGRRVRDDRQVTSRTRGNDSDARNDPTAVTAPRRCLPPARVCRRLPALNSSRDQVEGVHALDGELRIGNVHAPDGLDEHADVGDAEGVDQPPRHQRLVVAQRIRWMLHQFHRRGRTAPDGGGAQRGRRRSQSVVAARRREVTKLM